MGYLLHYIGVEAFGILCDRLDPGDPYEKAFGKLWRIKRILCARTVRNCGNIYLSQAFTKGGESAQEYMAALQKLSLHCKFGNYLKSYAINLFLR